MVKRALTLLTSILIALPLLMPFNIYGAGETQIVPSYTSSTTQQEWQTKLRVTNYCEGTNASTASCKLSFYVTGPYYGIINIDGYDSSGTHWINGGYIFVADGYGEYNYNFYQNGIKAISSVSIWGVQLVQPDSNVDLTQIIQLLTSINSYNQQEVGNQSTQIQQLQTIINDLIISNGYLETITKLKQFNFPFESYYINSYLLRDKSVVSYQNLYDYVYPVFRLNANETAYNVWLSSGNEYHLICSGFNYNTASDIKNNDLVTDLDITNIYQLGIVQAPNNVETRLLHIVFKNNGASQYFPIVFRKQRDVIFVFGARSIDSTFNNISTDFALRFGLSNRLLDDLHLIANGTAQSSSAASSSDHANEQLQTNSNTLFEQEKGFKSDMQSAMQNVNNTFRLQDMGTKFVSSAQWVRTQYEQLTNNTPFASLITFSLITGLALILLGKVYK